MLLSEESERSHMPSSWHFDSTDDLDEFMRDPSSVVRVEWRKVRRDQHRGWTSHSWLEAYLLDGRRMRLERFMDVGLTESIVATDKSHDDDSVIWDNHSASWTELQRPLTVVQLRDLALAASSEPYSVTERNCHHFVRDMWNEIVIPRLRQSHYPDRMKTSVLTSLGSLVLSGLAPFASVGSATPAVADLGPPAGSAVEPPPPLLRRLCSMSSSQCRPARPPRTSDGGRRSPLFPAPLGEEAELKVPHARLSARQEEDDRICGELHAAARADLSESALDARFAQAVRAGLVYVLEDGGELLKTELAPGAATCAAWAASAVPRAAAEALQLARLLAATDVVGLVSRIVPPFAEIAAADPVATGALAPSPSAPRFASLSSQPSDVGSRAEPCDPAAVAPPTSASLPRFASLSSQPELHEPVAEVRFVVLVGTEVRLAAYALARPPARRPGRPRRLRLLSGDARSRQEGSFVYTVCGLAVGEARPSAADFVQEELDALRCALMTGEWGFVTLL